MSEKDVSDRPVVTRLKASLYLKGWGSETWVVNCPDYCLKFLDFNAGTRGSLHFHADKHETWYVLNGEGWIEWRDPDTALPHGMSLRPGDIVDIPRFCSHQITADKDMRIVEVSTQHKDSDTYRIAPGASQEIK